MKGRLIQLANVTVLHLRVGLRIGLDELRSEELLSADSARGNREIRRAVTEVILPEVRTKVGALAQKDWANLAKGVGAARDKVELAIDRYAQRLDPKSMELLLDLQEGLQNTLTFYEVFPDLAGVPAHELPRTKTSPSLLQVQGYDSTANEIRLVLARAVELSAHCAQDALLSREATT